MNKINPLYVIALLSIIIVILYVKKTNMQDRVNSLSYGLEKTKQIGTYSKELKREFGDKQKQVSIIKKILKSQGFLKKPHKFNVTNSSITIELKNLDSRKTNKIIGKILNTSVFISSLDIKDVDFNKSIKIKIKL